MNRLFESILMWTLDVVVEELGSTTLDSKDWLRAFAKRRLNEPESLSEIEIAFGLAHLFNKSAAVLSLELVNLL